MTSDPISDMLARIRNALKAGLPSVELPGSRIKGEILRVMKEEGYITDFTMTNGVPRVLSIELKYNDDAEPAIRGMRRESKPGLRKFCVRRAGYPERAGRYGYRGPEHLGWHPQRQGSPQAQARR